MIKNRPASEMDATIFLRVPDNHRISVQPPESREDDRASLGKFHDGATARVYVGDTVIWTRDPAAFRALALALSMAADELDEKRAAYRVAVDAEVANSDAEHVEVTL